MTYGNSITRHLDIEIYPATQASPAERQGHTQVLFDGALYVYAGRTNSDRGAGSSTIRGRRSYLNDLFKYNLQSKEWFEVEQVNPQANRHNHTAVVYKGAMYVLFGSADEGYCDEFLKFDFHTNMWSHVPINPNSRKPHTRHGHSAVLHGDQMIVFGGHFTDPTKKSHKRTFFNDLWVYDFVEQTWTEIYQTGLPVPRERTWHSVSLDTESNQMLLHGGWWKDRLEHYLADVWSLDLSNMRWTEVKFTPNSLIPFERNRSTLTHIGSHRFLLIGGNYFNTKTRQSLWFNDAFVIEVFHNGTAQSSKLITSPNMPVLSNHTLTLLNQDSDPTMFIFGGEVRRKRFNHITIAKYHEEKTN